ncbi:MAG: S9 family peptidase [Opitutae bacterium]|nr:S9 family peptidase [Opitutae bacterium]
MHKFPSALVAGLLALAGSIPGRAATPAALPAPRTPAEIPVEYFFRPPAVRGATLNPAGTHLAMLATDLKKDSTSLLIVKLADNSVGGMRGDSTYDVSAYSWAGDDRLVFSLARDNRYAWGLYAMQRDDARSVVTLNTYDAVEVLGSPRARPDNLLVWIRQSARDEGREGDLVELDLRRDHFSKFGGSRHNVRHTYPPPPKTEGILRWFRDRRGEVRYATTHDHGRLQFFRRRDDDRWDPVAIDLDRDAPLAVDEDPQVLFVAHLNAQGTRDLVRFNTTDGTIGPALHTDEKYDFSDGAVRFSGDEREVVGLVYARQAPEQVWLHREEAARQAALDAVLPANRLNFVASRSRDGHRVLVVSSSDRHPGSLYLLDRDTKKLRRLAEFAPWLPENLMAPVRVVTFQARDGLKLDGYVTVPLGHDESRPGPMIVLPHGGPWVRDVWGYDAESQFFASRGYLVFRPNYRGSAGYNDAISQQPRVEFRQMHEDVTDGVRALVAAKIADPAHLAIVGASFGGYLALCGAAFEPGLYRCAVTIAGVFDWEQALKDDRANNPESFRRYWLRRELGDPKANREKFEAMSPYLHAKDIRVPVLVIHGKEDTNADVGQSRRLVKALKKAGVPHEALFIADEGHGFASLQHRVELFTRVEAFLKKNL